MNIRDRNCLGALDRAMVREFERRHGFELPADYKSFLLQHHGGVPVPAFFGVNGPLDSFETELESLYGLGDKPGYSVEAWVGAGEVPADLLVIGDDGCCGHVAIGISGPRCGAVFYLNHSYAVGEPQNAVQVAADFSNFIASLRDHDTTPLESVSFEDAVRWGLERGYSLELEDADGRLSNLNYEEFREVLQRACEETDEDNGDRCEGDRGSD